jgi:hypothetical protein
LIVLFTDYGITGPYTGQLKAVLARMAPQVPVIDLFADAPTWDARASAYLLAAFAPEFPAGSVFLCVVDPGVGSARDGGFLRADGRCYVGPDNGLFEIVARRAIHAEWWSLTWRPVRMSATFHGRDWFAPAAAEIACGRRPSAQRRPLESIRRLDWPDDLAEVIYIDSFGNAVTGVRAETVPDGAILSAAGHRLNRARTFSDVPLGAAFWYENANGLVEIAVNSGRAAESLGLKTGVPVAIIS